MKFMLNCWNGNSARAYGVGNDMNLWWWVSHNFSTDGRLAEWGTNWSACSDNKIHRLRLHCQNLNFGQLKKSYVKGMSANIKYFTARPPFTSIWTLTIHNIVIYSLWYKNRIFLGLWYSKPESMETLRLETTLHYTIRSHFTPSATLTSRR